jgi:hypothetical protein
MSAVIPFNWQNTTNAAGSFVIQSGGFVQGFAHDDPANMFNMTGGIVSPNEMIAMYGGLAINDVTLPNTGNNPPQPPLGPFLSRATNVTANAALSVTGFTVFNQAYAGTITPQGNVPLFPSFTGINYYRLGSNMRIPVACSAAMSANEGFSIGQLVSWDFFNQQLVPFVAAWAGESVASATYTTATGILSLTFATAPFGAGIGATNDGVFVSVSGLAGTGAVASLNGNFPIVSTGTAGTVINVQAPAGLGTIAITSATGSLAAGGGALNVRVLEVLIGNCMTVPPVANGSSFINYNTNGNAALILV